MNLNLVDIPRAGAREAARDYARVARTTSNAREAREFAEIARAYRIAARDGVPLIALTPTIAAGGTVVRTRVVGKGHKHERHDQYLLPALAVCRADAAYCYCSGVRDDGSVGFIDSLGRSPAYQRGLIHLNTQLEQPHGFYNSDLHPSRWSGAWSAMVPIVPPKHRPARGLGDHLVLWEVDDWAWRTTPRPPGDPALLRHVGGDIYAVLATWDLTDLEKLVLSGRPVEA